MSRHDGSITTDAAAPEQAAELPELDRQARHCLGDKLAHRALGEARPRSTVRALSTQARDRLYARMFPSDICTGAIDHDRSDLLS